MRGSSRSARILRSTRPRAAYDLRIAPPELLGAQVARKRWSRRVHKPPIRTLKYPHTVAKLRNCRTQRRNSIGGDLVSTSRTTRPETSVSGGSFLVELTLPF